MARRPARPQLVPSEPAPAQAPVHPFDHLRGTDTSGLIPASALVTGSPADRHVTAYYGVAPSILRTLIDRWHQQTAPAAPIGEVTFLDIGAGKGRAMIVAAENPFREVVGIELNPALAAIARSNISIVTAQATQPAGIPRSGITRQTTSPVTRSRDTDPVSPGLLAPLRLVEGDALTTPLPDTPTLAFLFHPFEAPALRSLLRHLEVAFAPHPGSLDLLYVNAEHLALLHRNPTFTLLWEGNVPMSTEDHLADLREIATQLDYGSTGDEHCAILRFTGRPRSR